MKFKYTGEVSPTVFMRQYRCEMGGTIEVTDPAHIAKCQGHAEFVEVTSYDEQLKADGLRILRDEDDKELLQRELLDAGLTVDKRWSVATLQQKVDALGNGSAG